MGLKVETSYVNKVGATVQLNTPKMKVMGKLMDDNEEHTFFVLADGIKQWDNGKFPSYQMFVKFDGEDGDAFNLDLSGQAYQEISRLDPKKGDKLKISKIRITNQKTGSEMPVIQAEIIGKTNKQSNLSQHHNTVPRNVEFPVTVEQYLQMYKDVVKVQPDSVNINTFIAGYFRVKSNRKPVIDDLERVFNDCFGGMQQEKVE